MAGLDERALETALAGLREELRGGLDRLERLWGDPLDEGGALRQALREELRPPRGRARLPERLPASPGGRRRPSSPGSQSDRSDETCAAADRPSPGTQSVRNDWANAAAGRGGGGRAWRRSATPEPVISEQTIGARLAAWRLIHRHRTAFDSVIGLIIVLSSIMLGVEIQCDLDGNAACTQRAHDLESRAYFPVDLHSEAGHPRTC
ncbi:unnamed protein product [Prorocentrum cordatum]|uniref:Uncharacterized protein n=1 Tax=Prorocentrum cordatum TaxID=2364126 RepID=A0ABN9XW72_9DINO|nr:unnamed protein product [Polarella glacialis]